ncbi:MAG: hypothetical protein JW779_04200 [Candidatus Thorarchaeota archaeon]|nr:hypothetical protein [Candidatus Thorarchaeota archaeon]
MDGIVHRVSSTEIATISVVTEDAQDGRLHVVLDHSPVEGQPPMARFDLEVWSYNTPILLVRFKTTNLSNSSTIEDLKLYNFMDFDVGGPTSYKDDVGTYDPVSGIMAAYDDNPLCVVMVSNPKADAWEIGSPTKLRIDEENRDLSKNLELGPRDIATALQWNLGSYDSGEHKTVDVVLAAATNPEEAKALAQKGLEMFDKKIQ